MSEVVIKGKTYTTELTGLMLRCWLDPTSSAHDMCVYIGGCVVCGDQ